MEPHAVSKELTVTQLHPGISKEQVVKATEWNISFAPELTETARPTDTEVQTLRDLERRTRQAHGNLTAG